MKNKILGLKWLLYKRNNCDIEDFRKVCYYEKLFDFRNIIYWLRNNDFMGNDIYKKQFIKAYINFYNTYHQF